MEYFKLLQDKNYSNGPKIVNWYGKINTQEICYGNAHKFPERMLFHVESDKEMCFTEVVLQPFLLVDSECKKMFQLYEPKTPFRNVVLLDAKYKRMNLYQMPFLKKVELVEKKMLAEGEALIVKMPEKELVRKSIFQIVDKEKTVTIIRLDLLESILRRKANGFKIEPVKVKGI